MTAYSYKHIFTHLQYVGCPEFVAPETTESFIQLVKIVRQFVALRSNNIRILVHCNDGAGSTGTFIALYQLTEELDNKFFKSVKSRSTFPETMEYFSKETIDIFKTVVYLRKERCKMVSIFL